MRWVDVKHKLHEVDYGMKVVPAQIEELRLKYCENNKKMFHCQNFTDVFNQRAGFVLAFEKLWMPVANVLDEVLQTNHGVDVETNGVKLLHCNQERSTVGTKMTL